MNLHGNKRNASLLLLAISVVAMGIGIGMLMQHTVDCGGQAMQAGDVCQEIIAGGRGATKTVAQQRTENMAGAGFAFLISLAAGVYAVRNLVLIRRARPVPVIQRY
jgi:hypothetical protein